MAVGRVWVRVTPLALLPIDCSADGRMSNEKTHGIRTVSSGQDTKADHGTTIASQEASDPNALRSGHEGEEPRQEEADAHVRTGASAARRALRWCSPSRSGRPRRLRARPVAVERSRPRWRSFPQDLSKELKAATCQHEEGGSPLAPAGCRATVNHHLRESLVDLFGEVHNPRLKPEGLVVKGNTTSAQVP
jgi:hypothetical protein